MLKIDEISENLYIGESGLWIAQTIDEISYPSDGNELCAEIEDSSFWFKHRNKAILSVMNNFSPRGAIFDIGGGNGYVAKGLMEAGFDCVLVEPGREGARKALERGVENVVCATLESADFYPGALSNVGLFDVVEHIEDDGALNISGV
jgi:hypothetical protein